MNWYVSLSRIEKVEQQPKKAYVNVWKVDCRESIVEVTRRIFQDCSENEKKRERNWLFFLVVEMSDVNKSIR